MLFRNLSVFFLCGFSVFFLCGFSVFFSLWFFSIFFVECLGGEVLVKRLSSQILKFSVVFY